MTLITETEAATQTTLWTGQSALLPHLLGTHALCFLLVFLALGAHSGPPACSLGNIALPVEF
jgi:hypothetical protein